MVFPLSPNEQKTFILENTSPLPCLNLPSIQLYQADEVHSLWHKTQAQIDEIDLPPPFWAFSWAGGEALSLYILEHPEIVKGKNVLDFASGSGLVAIAAKKAGALSVLANDIDSFACEAIALNAALNHVSIAIENKNLVGKAGSWDIVLAGDVFYDKTMSQDVVHWLPLLDKQKTTILVGDPGRAYFPHEFMKEKATLRLAVSKLIEEAEFKNVKICQFIN